MPQLRLLSFFASAFASSMTPVLVTCAVGVKSVSLIPLLSHWSKNESLYALQDIKTGSAAISRVGPYEVHIHDPHLIERLQGMDVKMVDEAAQGSYVALSDLYLDGCEIPRGTFISTDRT